MAYFQQEHLALREDMDQVKGKVDMILEVLHALWKEAEASTTILERPTTVTQPHVT